MKKKLLNGYVVRGGMVLFWLVLIFAWLYLPAWWPTMNQQKTLNILAWADVFSPTIVSRFERETGIRVNMSYYESNEELMVKLRATKGAGYDLVIPSDYAVDILRKEGVLQPLDKSKLLFFDRLNPALMNTYFDPDNLYSVPYEWAVFGIGYDKNYFAQKNMPLSWSLIFAPEYDYTIAMINDPFVAVPLASLYLYGAVKQIDRKQVGRIKEVLRKQRQWVSAYADFRADYLLATKNCPVIASSSSYILRSMKEYKHIGFYVPREGTLITIENFAIPHAVEHEEYAYEFMNFMYRPEIIKEQYSILCFFPAITGVDKFLDLGDMKSLYMTPASDFKQFQFFRFDMFKRPVTEKDIQHLWVAIKS